MGRLVVGVVAVLALTAGVNADVIAQFPMNFSDTAQSASSSVGVSGSATLSGSGTYYSWVGWPTSAWSGVTINFNNPTIGLGNTAAKTSDPDGNGLVTFEVAPDTLTQGKLDDLYVDIKDGAAWNLSLNALSMTSGFGASLTLAPGAGSVTSYTFDMTGASTGTYSSGAFPSITYNIAASGTTYGAQSGWSYTGTLSLPGVGNVNLGTVLNVAGTAGNYAQTASGTMVLTELAGPYPKDVAVALHADAGAISVGFSATSSGYSYNNYSGGTNPYYIINLNYGVTAGSVNIGATHIDLYDTIVDAIPEPATLAVLGLGGALLTVARRRLR
jgi:hypothetical protein